MDIDFGDFILPVAFDGCLLRNGGRATPTEVAAAMMHAIRAADAIRDEIAAHELQLRGALEKATAPAGSIVPIWLRAQAWIAGEGRGGPVRRVHEMVALNLNEELNHEANGSNRITSVDDIECFVRNLKAQRRRASTRARLDAAGSLGMISDVALALMELRGYEPREVLSYLRACRGTKRKDGLLHLTPNTRETLTLVEGVVQARIDFAGGSYSSGKLTLEGDYPATLAIAARRRQLSAFVDHPAFRAMDATVVEGRCRAGMLVLRHTVQSVLVEDAVQSPSKSDAGMTAAW